MTVSGGRLELRVLGPIEGRLNGVELQLGGAKQRALLAVLLLRAGSVVPLERLIDDVWGDTPPPSAGHSVEAYVSRLRRLFAGHGLSLARRGAGYCLELDGAVLDAATFERLADDAAAAAAADEHERVAALAREALVLWRGPPLADVSLASSARVDTEHLEERRLRLLEQRFAAELSLGRDEALVAELQALVRQNPYREQLVGQLMVALYRSGRQADALAVYQTTRVALDEDLGLQPSAELRQLSGRIVRQDPELRRPAPDDGDGTRHRAVGPRATRVAGLVLVGATAAAAVAFAAQGSAPKPAVVQPAPNRLALVLPQSRGPLTPTSYRLFVGVRNAAILHQLEPRTLFIGRRGTDEEAGRTAEELRRSGTGVAVVLGDGPAARALARHVRRLRGIRFVFVDASLRELSLEAAPNAVAVRFSDDETSHLVGYMSGLVERKDDSARVDAVSVVAGTRTARTRRLVSAFVAGVRKAAPRAKIRVDYSSELVDPAACERLANRQIDNGADVVFAVAGRCGLGALAVARYRNVWGVGADEDGVRSGADVLAVTYKEWERVTIEALEALVARRLPMGRDLVRGLDDDYAVGLDMSSALPAAIQSAVIHRCSEIRAGSPL